MGKKAAGPGEVAPSFDWSVLGQHNNPLQACVAGLSVYHQTLYLLKRECKIPSTIRMPQDAEEKAWDTIKLLMQPQLRQ